MDKILVIGTGLLGGRIIDLSLNYETYGTYFSRPQDNMTYLDKNNREKVFELIRKINPDVVFDTGAMHNVDYCELHEEESRKINVEGTRNIADACKEIGSKLIFVSTDYVFDGIKGNYSEEDRTNPLSTYGRHKLEAENLIIMSGADFIIARPSVIYGVGKNNFALWVINELSSDRVIRIVDDQYNNPTFATNLGEMLIKLYEQCHSGIFHTCGSETLSRYEFAIKISEIFGFDKNLIKPINTEELGQKARRPMMCSMNVKKVSKILEPNSSTKGLKIMKEEMESERKNN